MSDKRGMALKAKAFALLTALGMLTALSAGGQEAGTLRIPTDQWQFHVGDDAQCATGVDAACAWQPHLPDTLRGDKIYWKRAQITLPENLIKTPELALVATAEVGTYEAYVNGQRIGISSKSGPLQRDDSGPVFRFQSALARNGRMVLTIRTLPQWRARLLASQQPYVLAPAEWVNAVIDAEMMRYLRMNATHYLCFAAVGFSGFVFLLLYSVNPRLWEYLWLALILASVAWLRVVEIGPIVHLGLPVWMDVALYLLGNCLMPVFLIEFVFRFLNRPVPMILRLVQAIGFTDAYYAFNLPAPQFLSWFVIFGTPMGILIATLTQLLLLPMCFRSKLPEMRWIGASILFITVENAARMAKQLGLPNAPQDVMWRGLDIDLRGISYLLFALVMLIAMTFRLRRIQNRNRQIEQEMAAARSIQQILIPDQVPHIPGLEIESAYLPAQEVGGDFFQVLPIADADADGPCAFIILGDVSGKGLKAAMTVSLLVGTMRAFAQTSRSPGELLTGLNRLLYGRADGFTTCLALMVMPGGKLTLANAGHPNPYLNGREVETEANLPLGLTPEVCYSEMTLEFSETQHFTLVTDGVVESASASTHELFGFERTQAISAKAAAVIAEAARSFSQGAPQADDITVLSIVRTMQPA